MRRASPTNARFLAVAKSFTNNRSVSLGGGKGFGSGALKVHGKIFAMMSSKGSFIVKLPKERVDELVSGGDGKLFNPAPGRQMKEWLTVEANQADWIALAKEAYDFVKQKGM